jgi:hypothetical protein
MKVCYPQDGQKLNEAVMYLTVLLQTALSYILMLSSARKLSICAEHACSCCYGPM